MAQRLVLLISALAIATVGWFVLGESESLIAEETAAAPTGKVLATVNGTALTEEQVVELAAGRLLAIDRQRHDLIKQTVEGEVQNMLIEQEASKRDMTSDELLKAEVDQKAAEIPAAEVDAFYEQQKQRSGGRIQPKEQIESQIRNYLAFEAFKERLFAGADVSYSIEPFRVDVEATGPSKGGDDAAVTIIEFSDFECPFCSRVNPTLKQVEETYGDKIRIVFRQFPLDRLHPNARKAGEASLCADDQGKFWEMHDAMFADQKNLAVEGLRTIAGTIEGLDTETFNACLDSSKYADQVEADVQAGGQAGVSGTPAFFINGIFLNGAQPFDEFKKIIDEELGG